MVSSTTVSAIGILLFIFWLFLHVLELRPILRFAGDRVGIEAGLIAQHVFAAIVHPCGP